MRRIATRTLGLVALAAACVAGGAAAAAASPQTTSGFVIVSSPAVGTNAGLSGVVALSAGNVWAVGGTSAGNLIEHWNGSAWSKSRVRHPSGSSLSAISAGGGAVWTVGETPSGIEAYHRVGSSWVSVPMPSGYFLALAVKVFSDTNVWVGGEDQDDSHFLLHWNGMRWTRITDADIIGPIDDYTTGIAGTASHIFSTVNSDGGDGSQGVLERERSLTNWQIIGGTGVDLGGYFGLSASSASNVWAVGSGNNFGGVESPIATRWNGTTSTNVPVPSHPTVHQLNAVVAISPTNVWTVGQRSTSTTQATLIDHYTGGASFTDLGGPNTPGVDNVLLGIAEVPGSPSDLWAVGYAGGGALILHHS